MKQRAILFFFIGIMTGILQAQTLTLKDAGQLFLKQNLSLIAARYDMDIAQAQVLQARLFENQGNGRISVSGNHAHLA